MVVVTKLSMALVIVTFCDWLDDVLEVTEFKTWLVLEFPICILTEDAFDGMLVFSVLDATLVDGKRDPSEA